MARRSSWTKVAVLAAAVLAGGTMAAGGAAALGGRAPGPATGSAPAAGASLRVPLTVCDYGERMLPELPFWTGVPLPRGAVRDALSLRLSDEGGRSVPAQFDVQARWLDGSVKWVLVSFACATGRDGSRRFLLTHDAQVEPAAPRRKVSVVPDVSCWDVTTGPLKFRLNRLSFAGISQAWLDLDGDGQYSEEEMVVQEGQAAGIVLVGRDGKTYTSRFGSVSAIDVERSGPVHAVVAVRGDLRAEGSDQPLLDYVMRFHAFAGSSLVRVVLTVHNPRASGRAQDGGRWVLGLPGTVLFESLQVVQPIRLPEGARRVSLSAEPGKLLDRIPLPAEMELYQDSSGGENWFSRTHVNRDNVIPLSFRGYKVSYRGREIGSGLRASPWVDVSDMRWGLSCGLPAFWQNFPKALSVDADGTLRVGLWPGRFHDLHELQGGEQKTHEYWLYFRHRRGDRASKMPFDRVVMPACLDRPMVWAAPEAVAAADALDPMVPARAGQFALFEAVVNAAVKYRVNLFTHREDQDEYGWRNFGDTPARNESDKTTGPADGLSVVSHYNNEYDLGLGMVFQALRDSQADPDLARKWYQLGLDALWHEADIDIYHSRLDPYPMYNGGTFTHTAHGVDAGRSSHRASPRDEMYGQLQWPWGRGGAPESGHYRSRGILTAYLLTGDRHLLEAARDVTDGVAYKVGNDKFAQIDIPDRCAGNNLQILLDAYLLEGRPEHLRLCEKIVDTLAPEKVLRRSGQQALANLDWSAALYVKSLGRYIQVKAEQGVKDQVAIAQHLDYSARIRAPFDRRGRMTGGTWSPLMCEVMMQAADLCTDPAEKQRFLDAAQAAFHACDRYVGPDGQAAFWNSKSTTMLLQGGGLYMRHALKTGLEPVATQPATQPASQPTSRPAARAAPGASAPTAPRRPCRRTTDPPRVPRLRSSRAARAGMPFP